MTATPSSPMPPPSGPPVPPPPSGPPPTPPPSGPPVPPAAKQLRKRGTWLIALVALLMSLVSLVVAFASLTSARAAQDAAADAERLAEALAPEEPDAPPPASSDPVTDPTTGPPPIDGPQETETPPQSFDPQATFTVHYADEVLIPQVTDVDDAYIDLDEPRVVFDQGAADVVLTRGGFGDSNPPQFDLQQSSVTAAQAGSPDVTPEECIDRLRTSPLNPSQEVPAQRATVLCLVTSLSRAGEQGIDQKLVVLHVSALGDEGRVTIELDAWGQPR